MLNECLVNDIILSIFDIVKTHSELSLYILFQCMGLH